MTKHLSFWLGVFAAALLIVPIAAGIMGAAEQELRRIAVVVFVFVAGLVLALVVALFFRDWILRKLFGRAEATLDDVSASLIAGVSAASAGDRDAATAHAQALVQRGMGWYAWTNFYRWVIATAVALLLAFGAFMGTVLLFEQNRKLGEQTEVLRAQGERLAEQTGFMEAQTALMQAQTERLEEQTAAAAMQNEIMSLSLVTEIRAQMLATIEERSLGEWLQLHGSVGADMPLATYARTEESCRVWLDQAHILASSPSAATVGAIAELTARGTLGEDVLGALELLTRDRNGGVALGAIMVLDLVGHPTGTGTVRMQNVIVEDRVQFRSDAHALEFDGSYVTGLRCEGCEVQMQNSVFYQVTPHLLGGTGNLHIPLPRDEDPEAEGYLWDGINVTPATERPTDFDFVLLGDAPYVGWSRQAWMHEPTDGTVCEEMAEIARGNPLLTLRAPE
ncbi:hypothetical protein [uncultured Tateyamaria sp.]|uniref:hypothetical protein n=1 Tax=uncultured Tateyamaria sp. TaxID=455651 RepID=UPI002601C561|nr:hypothetical protein [uncultured Tateyamaria sp.]